MGKSGKNIETTRIDTPLGVFLVVVHSDGVKAGQTFSQKGAGGAKEWYAQCVDWYSQDIPPITTRVPEKGGYASLDELQAAIEGEISGSTMQTDYWSDR